LTAAQTPLSIISVSALLTDLLMHVAHRPDLSVCNFAGKPHWAAGKFYFPTDTDKPTAGGAGQLWPPTGAGARLGVAGERI